jgi:hypothetical protein
MKTTDDQRMKSRLLLFHSDQQTMNAMNDRISKKNAKQFTQNALLVG